VPPAHQQSTTVPLALPTTQAAPPAIPASKNSILPPELPACLAATSTPTAISATMQANAPNATTDTTSIPAIVAWRSLPAQSPIAHSAPTPMELSASPAIAFSPNRLTQLPARLLLPAPTEGRSMARPAHALLEPTALPLLVLRAPATASPAHRTLPALPALLLTSPMQAIAPPAVLTAEPAPLQLSAPPA